MEKFKQRLCEFARNRYDMGQTRFEDYCGISRGTISNIKGTGPSTANLMRIASRCPELNLRWLLTGEGEMLERKPDTDAKQAIYDLTIENIRLKKKIAELEGKGAVAV